MSAAPRAPSRRTSAALLRDRRGASLVEYVVLVGFVAVLGILGLRAFGTAVDTKIECQADAIAGGAGCTAAGVDGKYTLTSGGSGQAPGSGDAANGGDPASAAPPMELAAYTEDDGGGNPVWGFIKQVGGFFGGIGYGIGTDAVGLWDLVTDPWTTIKDAGTGIWNTIKTRAESDAVKAIDQWKNGDEWGAAWTIGKGMWASTSGLLIETFVIDEGVQEDWKNGNYGGAVGRVTWNVGSWFIPGAGWAARGGKALSKFSKAGRAAKAAEELAKAEKAANAAEDAAKAKKAGEVAAKAVDQAKQLPKKLEDGYGHAGTKHAPKTPDELAKIEKGDFPGKKVTYFDDQAALDRAIDQAPEKLPDVLAKNPQKAAEWEQFIDNPKEGGRFGFRYEADGPVGRGYTKNPDGTVSPLGPYQGVYVEYRWVKGPGGKLVPKVYNAYPVDPVVPVPKTGTPGGPTVVVPPGDVPDGADPDQEEE